MFHGQELSLETVPSLLPVRQYGTVCLSLSDQLRLLLVLSASWKPIYSTFRFNLLLSFINIVMHSRSGFVIGWVLNYPRIVLYRIVYPSICSFVFMFCIFSEPAMNALLCCTYAHWTESVVKDLAHHHSLSSNYDSVYAAVYASNWKQY